MSAHSCQAIGSMVFSHTDERVTPIAHCTPQMKPLEGASMRALLAHERDYAKDRRILQQVRHDQPLT